MLEKLLSKGPARISASTMSDALRLPVTTSVDGDGILPRKVACGSGWAPQALLDHDPSFVASDENLRLAILHRQPHSIFDQLLLTLPATDQRVISDFTLWSASGSVGGHRFLDAIFARWPALALSVPKCCLDASIPHPLSLGLLLRRSPDLEPAQHVLASAVQYYQKHDRLLRDLLYLIFALRPNLTVENHVLEYASHWALDFDEPVLPTLIEHRRPNPVVDALMETIRASVLRNSSLVMLGVGKQVQAPIIDENDTDTTGGIDPMEPFAPAISSAGSPPHVLPVDRWENRVGQDFWNAVDWNIYGWDAHASGDVGRIVEFWETHCLPQNTVEDDGPSSGDELEEPPDPSIPLGADNHQNGSDDTVENLTADGDGNKDSGLSPPVPDQTHLQNVAPKGGELAEPKNDGQVGETSGSPSVDSNFNNLNTVDAKTGYDELRLPLSAIVVVVSTVAILSALYLRARTRKG
ncbi:hypothetical protein B0T16DRAFT_71872 [Cercophora newfieldiana]|uniref:Uncharacterized protein n=1 Tax=Cercophora newfieldiana TaxID=92897 RepID=A0AA39YT03_9PEZI|nr:hypothetical protein B0T16DRAFT_71872 [Cercophora newfieldiana]